MDYLTILAIIVVVFFIYIIYTYFFMTSMIFNKPVNLKNSTQLSYDAKLMKQPNSPRYSYEFWLIIQSNNPTDEEHVILNRGTLFAFSLKGSRLSLMKNPSSITNGVVTPNATATNTVEITSTFPFQKWTQVVMNVDGNRVDIYIDGKLYKTLNDFSIGTDKTTAITIGNPKTEGQMIRFTFWPNTVDPQTVWNRFSQGNGVSRLAKFFGNYKADMSILKENQSIFNFSIL